MISMNCNLNRRAVLKVAAGVSAVAVTPHTVCGSAAK
jgi:hypothetical protein